MRKFFFIFSILAVAVVNGGGCNLYSDLAVKTSDAAIIDDVKNYVNASHWTDAINKWALLSPSGKLDRNNKLLLASAYAGRGGLDVLNLINTLNTNASAAAPQTLFQVLLSAMRNSTASKVDDEIVAQGIITSISTQPGSRTVDENLVLAFIELAKLGDIFNLVGDTDQDGTVDATFDQCTMVSTVYAKEVVVGMNLLVASLAATGSSIASNSLAAYNAGCANIILNAAGFCAIYDVNDPALNGVIVQAAKTLVGEGNLSVGLDTPLVTRRDIYEFTAPCTGCPGATTPPLCP